MEFLLLSLPCLRAMVTEGKGQANVKQQDFTIASMSHCIDNKPLTTEKLLSCYKIKGFQSLLVCSAFVFCRKMAFVILG